MKKVALALAAIAAVFGLSACAKNVDPTSVHAQLVPGSSNLYRFCDGPTLVYYSHWTTDSDEYEAMWPGYCWWSGKEWVYSVNPQDYDNKGMPKPTNGNLDDDDH